MVEGKNGRSQIGASGSRVVVNVDTFSDFGYCLLWPEAGPYQRTELLFQHTRIQCLSTTA